MSVVFAEFVYQTGQNLPAGNMCLETQQSADPTKVERKRVIVRNES